MKAVRPEKSPGLSGALQQPISFTSERDLMFRDQWEGFS
jgi:hypothetical protein